MTDVKTIWNFYTNNFVAAQFSSLYWCQWINILSTKSWLIYDIDRWSFYISLQLQYKIGSMSSELKLDTVICQDIEELEFSSSNGDKVNVVHKLLDTFLWQGKWSKNNITTPKERRTASDNRWSNSLYFCLLALLSF